MKIAWVTPLDQRSAIGRFSLFVTAALRELGHEIILVRSETPAIQAANVARQRASSWKQWIVKAVGESDFDIAVYNIGDHFGFHAGLLEVMPRIRGAAIFHDAYLLNLFLGWRAQSKDRGQPMCYSMKLWVGSAEEVHKQVRRPDFLAVTESFPMIEWLARLADGAVTHARFYEPRLRAACAGPVRVIPLAYDSLGDFAALAGRSSSSGFRLLTFGRVNSNRRVESVLRVIGSSPLLKSVTHYRIAGDIETAERKRLMAVAREAGVTAVDFLGVVSDASLRTELEEADVICALRWPVLEGASASAIEAMHSGRPVVVTNAGFYKDLPSDLVFKVDPDNEHADLRRHLECLAQDRSVGERTGLAAAHWASTAFTAEAYADQLVPFLEEVIESQPLLRAADQVGRNLAGLGLKPGDAAIERIASAMGRLFLSDPKSPNPPRA